MEGQLIKICLSIYILSSVVRATVTTDLGTNETLSEDRHPRVIGRIVKLYSGVHPEPVYCVQEGFQADPVQCAIFYRCVRAASGRYTVFRFQCGPGTIYDPDVETCNFPQRTKRTNCGGFRSEQAEIPRLAPASPELPSPIYSRQFYATPLSDPATNTVSTIYPWVTAPSSKLQTPLQRTTTASIVSQNMQGGDPCIKDGFMGDSQDCRKFYRCVANQRRGFIRYEFSCSDSTVWDEDAQSCNHAWAVQRSRCGRTNTNFENNHSHTTQQSNKQSINNEQTPSTVQQQLQVNYGNKVSQTQTQISHGPVTQNQTQINYGDRDNTNLNSQVEQNQTQISYGSAVSQTQTQLNHGNNVMQTQLQIDHTKESSQTQTTIDNVDTDDLNQGYGNQPVDTSNPNQSGSIGNDRNECTESGFMGDSNDCKKFYRCVDNGRGGFIKYDFTCGEGTVWDPSIESCNHAWAVPKCGGKAPQSTSPQGVTQTTTTKVTESPQTPQDSATTNDYEDAGYGNQNSQPEPSSSSVSTSATEQPQTSATPSEGNQCKSSGFMGDKKNCKNFFRCVDNGNGGYTRYEFSCGEGTVWDSKIEACNHAWAVEKCGGDDSDVYQETTSSARPTSYDEMPEATSNSQSGYPSQPSTAPNFTDQPKPTEQQPTKKPTSEKECTQEGFVGDEEDCKKFYRCVNTGGGFTKYEFSCGEGTIWDSEITACNHPNSVKNPCSGESLNQTENISETPQETSSSGTQATSATEEAGTTEKPLTTKPSSDKKCSQEGFMGDDSDCKKFYRCVDNGKGGFIKYEFSCGEGTVWDSELNTCNHQSPDKSCGGTSSQGAIVSTEPERQEDETHTENTGTQATEQSTTAQSTQKPQSSNDKCTSEGFFGDSNDCKKFYRCVDDGKGGYTKYDFTCGDGTIWDQELQTCDHESSNTNCSKGSISDSQMNQLPTETAGQESSSSTGAEEHLTQKPYPPQNESRGKCSSEGFFANPDDCKKFYRCVDNGKGGYTKYDFSCGDGTVWIQEIQACDHDTGDTCSRSQSEQSLAPENGSEPQLTSTSTERTGEQPPDKQEDDQPEDSSASNSNEKCTSEGYYANKDDCRKFYRCVDNGNGGFTKYDFTCGEGTAWDSDLQTCNHINQVESCQGQENQSKPELDESTTTTSLSDSSSQSSTSGGSSTESSKPVNKDKCEQEGFYAHSQDCTKFYRCVDNGKGGFTKYDFTCGEGTIWDQDVQTCNHPQDVANPSCQQSAVNEPSTSSSTTSSSLGSSGTTSSTTEGNNGSDCSTKKPVNKNENCTKAGYYPDPDDCKKFYRCVDWDGNGEKFSVYHFECGDGTIWDPALDTCNHEDSVYPPRDCIGSQSQSENGNEETTTSQTTSDSTTEQSTTEQFTTEQTTTKESTTSEQTTQSSDKTTTEQSTDGTTTQQTEKSTTEQTTTQQSTTSEQTEATTTHQTTTQKTEETTTEQSTTSSEQTTEQSTTSSEQTTTQQTTEQTETMTTQQITTQQTEDSTTEQSATSSEQTITQQTTEQMTTLESTTSESTTEQSTTEQSSISTTESTTQATTEGTTQEPTTEHSTTTQTDNSDSTESSTSTTESSEASTTDSSGDQTTEISSSEKECPKTEDDQNLFVCPTSFKRHPKYCNMFYQCTEDDDTHDVQIATFRCPNETIYDEKQTKCVEEKKAEKKCDGEMAQKRRIKRFDTVYKEPITVTNERLKCPAPGHYPFEKENCSPAFLKCKKNKSSILRGYVYQCPQNYVYWSVSRRCEHKDHVRDCKKSYNDWSGRWEIPIERRNVAP